MRLTGLLTHTYHVTPGQLFTGADMAITAIHQTQTASTYSVWLIYSVVYTVQWHCYDCDSQLMDIRYQGLLIAGKISLILPQG